MTWVYVSCAPRATGDITVRDKPLFNRVEGIVSFGRSTLSGAGPITGEPHATSCYRSNGTEVDHSIDVSIIFTMPKDMSDHNA